MSISESTTSESSPRARSRSSPRSDYETSSAYGTSTPSTTANFDASVDLIRQQHLQAARTSIHNDEILAEIEAELEQDCDWLRNFLFASQVSHFTTRQVDCMLSYIRL